MEIDRIDLGKQKKIAGVDIKGALNERNTALVEEEFKDINWENNCSMLIDVGDVVYLSSSALRVFITKNRELKENGGEMFLLNPNEYFISMLADLGMEEDFRMIRAPKEDIVSLIKCATKDYDCDHQDMSHLQPNTSSSGIVRAVGEDIEEPELGFLRDDLEDE